MSREVFDEPELAGYVPNEGMPGRRRQLRIARVVIVVGIVALVVPGVLGTWQLAGESAARSCADYDRMLSRAEPSVAGFELFGPGGPGWYCMDAARGTALIGLGLIPYGGLAGAASTSTNS